MTKARSADRSTARARTPRVACFKRPLLCVEVVVERETFERSALGESLGASGFVTEVRTSSRWGHACVNPQPGFFGVDGKPAPRDVLRQQRRGSRSRTRICRGDRSSQLDPRGGSGGGTAGGVRRDRPRRDAVRRAASACRRDVERPTGITLIARRAPFEAITAETTTAQNILRAFRRITLSG